MKKFHRFFCYTGFLFLSLSLFSCKTTNESASSSADSGQNNQVSVDITIQDTNSEVSTNGNEHKYPLSATRTTRQNIDENRNLSNLYNQETYKFIKKELSYGSDDCLTGPETTDNWLDEGMILGQVACGGKADYCQRNNRTHSVSCGGQTDECFFTIEDGKTVGVACGGLSKECKESDSGKVACGGLAEKCIKSQTGELACGGRSKLCITNKKKRKAADGSGEMKLIETDIACGGLVSGCRKTDHGNYACSFASYLCESGSTDGIVLCGTNELICATNGADSACGARREGECKISNESVACGGSYRCRSNGEKFACGVNISKCKVSHSGVVGCGNRFNSGRRLLRTKEIWLHNHKDNRIRP